MGSSLEKKEVASSPTSQVVKQGWFAVLIDKSFALIILIVVGFAQVYWYVLKPLLTIEGKSRQQLSIRLPIAAVMILAPFYGLYLLPPVRDFISLNPTHTINHSNGYRILFPDRSYFVINSSRKGGRFDSKTYITYSGYTEGTFQKMEKGQCQMVPRGEKIRLGSEDPPTNAEGFKGKVGYVLRRDLGDLSGTDYLFEWAKHPSLWMDKKKLDRTTVNISTEASWETFLEEWDSIREESGEYRSFEVLALAREHAVICF